jgi:HEPN domain-containing protein
MLLYENAFDSISHGLEHLKLAKEKGNKKDFKHAMLAIFQGSELLLKQLLCLRNPILMFDKNSLYEKCKDPTQPMLEELFDCKSLEINKLSSEVLKHYPGNFNSSSLKIINKVAKVRNKIQHFGIQIEEEEEFTKLILELYYHVISPSFKIIGGIRNAVRFNDYFNGELEKIFSFFLSLTKKKS